MVVDRNPKRLADDEAKESILKHIKFFEEEIGIPEKKIKALIRSDTVMEAKKGGKRKKSLLSSL